MAVTLSLATPPMSPATSLGAGCPACPGGACRWPRRSVSSARVLYTVVSACRVPETTRRMEILPVNGSERVLKTSAASGPAGSRSALDGVAAHVLGGEGGALGRARGGVDERRAAPRGRCRGAAADRVTGKIWRRARRGAGPPPGPPGRARRSRRSLPSACRRSRPPPRSAARAGSRPRPPARPGCPPARPCRCRRG